jgi:hypothetical protein
MVQPKAQAVLQVLGRPSRWFPSQAKRRGWHRSGSLPLSGQFTATGWIDFSSKRCGALRRHM